MGSEGVNHKEERKSHGKRARTEKTHKQNGGQSGVEYRGFLLQTVEKVPRKKERREHKI